MLTTKYYYIILKILLHIVSLHSQRQIFSKWNSTFFWHYIACEPVKLLIMAPPNLLDISEFLLRYVAAVPREMWPENWRPLSASKPTSSWTWNAATHAETETLAWTSLQLACTQYPGSWLHHSSPLLGVWNRSKIRSCPQINGGILQRSLCLRQNPF